MNSFQMLTPKEQQVVYLIYLGQSTACIAQSLAISELTVKTHRKNINKKMGVHKTSQLIKQLINDSQVAPFIINE